MQAVGDAVQGLELPLDPLQEAAVAIEAEAPGHSGARAIGSDQEATGDVGALKPQDGSLRGRAPIPLAEPDLDARALRLARQVAHEPGGIGRHEEVAVPLQIDVVVGGRVDPDAADSANQPGRHPPLGPRFVHENPRGVDALAGFGLPLQNQDGEAPPGGLARAGETGKAGPRHHHIMVLRQATSPRAWNADRTPCVER